MIKSWKLFLESNKTNSQEDELITKFFGFDSEDVEGWFSDFLDEHPDLDFELSIVDDKMLFINFFHSDTNERSIRKDIYVVSDETLNHVKRILKQYNCQIVPEPGAKESGMIGDVYYAISREYMSIRVEKIK